MSIFNRAILIIALLLLVTAARSDGIYNPTAGGMLNFSGNIGGFGGPSNPSGPAVAQPTGKILMTDGASFILQTDAASKICRAGGC